MVKLYASLLSLTLTTRLALAVPLPGPSHSNGLDYYERDLIERDLDEEFSGREYLSDASDDLAARDPSFFGDIGKAFHSAENVAGKAINVAGKAIHVAEDIAQNPIVQAAASVIPGGTAVESVVGAMRNVEKFANTAKQVGQGINKIEQLGGALMKGAGKINNAIRTADRRVKPVGGALGMVKKIAQPSRNASPPPRSPSRRHRRDLEEDEELSRRDLDAEELSGREYDDFLAERNFFDDLD